MDFPQLFCGDSRELDRILPSDLEISTTITSPPYWDQIDYGHPRQLGVGSSYDRFLEELTQIFRQIYKFTSKSGTLWLVVDTVRKHFKEYLLPFDLCSRLEQLGWRLIEIIIWDKLKSRPNQGSSKLRDTFEYILLFAKSPRNFKYYPDRIREHELTEWWVRFPERYNPEGKLPTTIWRFRIPTQGCWAQSFRHFCPFPPELVERMLLLTTDPGDIVFDPFAGSGVVLAVAHAMGRNALGIELIQEYVDQFWSKVLPQILDQFKLRNPLREFQQMRRKLILLRQLKYAKLLGSKLDPAPDCIISICEPETKSQQIYLAYSQIDDELEILRKAHQMASRPPLSKFGIKPSIRIVSISEAKQMLSSSGGFWVYRRHHMFEHKLDPARLEDLCWEFKRKHGAIPLISNVAIYQLEAGIRSQTSLDNFR